VIDDVGTAPNGDLAQIEDLIHEVGTLRADLIDLERREAARVSGIPQSHQASARNLCHYLALRRHDIRPLQERLARLGLSSLGRAESHVLATVDAVLKALHHLAGRPWQPRECLAPAVGFDEGIDRLDAHTVALLGPEPAERAVRIMVTMPTEASENYLLVRELLDCGMNCMRINCAHDDAHAWGRMIDQPTGHRLRSRVPEGAQRHEPQPTETAQRGQTAVEKSAGSSSALCPGSDRPDD